MILTSCQNKFIVICSLNHINITIMEYVKLQYGIKGVKDCPSKLNISSNVTRTIAKNFIS